MSCNKFRPNPKGSYLIYYFCRSSSNANQWTARFGDPATGVDLKARSAAFTGNGPYGVIKFCPNTSGYKALPFAVADQIDFSKNNSATIIYWRPSTKVNRVAILQFLTGDKF
jgi:hypothetical protein